MNRSKLLFDRTSNLRTHRSVCAVLNSLLQKLLLCETLCSHASALFSTTLSKLGLHPSRNFFLDASLQLDMLFACCTIELVWLQVSILETRFSKIYIPSSSGICIRRQSTSSLVSERNLCSATTRHLGNCGWWETKPIITPTNEVWNSEGNT